MWLGIIIGLLLGAAFDSFAAAVLLAAIGGVAGAIVARRQALDDAGERPVELQHDILELQLQMQQAMQRIDQLEKRLQQQGVSAPAAEQPPSPARSASVAALPAQPVPAEEVLSTPPSFGRNPGEPSVRPEPEASRPAAESFAYRSVELEMPAAPSWLSEFVARWITGGNPIVKVGVLVLFLGLAFLLRYVAEHTVVPIALRYAGVAAGAIGLLLVGWRWRARPDHYGLILQGAGIGVLYLTTLAGMKLHPLIPAELGFAILIAVAAGAALLAILQDALVLAVVAALGGFAAPVLASTGSQNHLGLFGYLAVLNLGIVAIAWFKAWRLLNLVGFVCTLFLATAWGKQYYQPALFPLAEPFLLLFFVLYVLIAFLFARRTLADAGVAAGDSFADHVRQAAPQVSYVDASLVFGVPLACFGLQYLLVRSFENGPAYSALGFGLAYIVIGYGLFRQSGRHYALLSETMLALAVIFGSLAIPLGLDGEWTSAAWAVEAAGVYWVGIRQQRVHARLFALLLMFGAAVFFATELRPGGAATAAIDGSWLGCLMLALSLGWTYRLQRLAPAGCLHAFEQGLRPWLIVGGSLFVALLPFLLLRANWASAVLAMLGTLAIFAARRLDERPLAAWGGAYQLLAGICYLGSLPDLLGGVPDGASPFLHSAFWCPLLIALAAFVGARMLQRREASLASPALGWTVLAWSALWWAFAWSVECDRMLPAATAVPALLAVAVLSAALWRELAGRLAWPELGQATLAYPPVLAILLGAQMASGFAHPLAGWGALAWPLALVVHGRLLQAQPAWLERRLLRVAHVGGAWLFLVVAALELHWYLAGWGGPDSAWSWFGWLLAPLAYLAALSSEKLGERWPLAEFRTAYAVAGALPVVVFLFAWTWSSTLLGNGAAPLPHLPLLNPLEIGQFAALLAIARWWRGLAEYPERHASRPLLPALLGLTAFAVISSLVLRTCHQWGGVPWQAAALLDSMLAQSALSIVWSVIAIGLMLFAHRRGVRWLWLVGATLVAIVVGKLFLVELAASGSLERIVSFIVVGLLLLLVGYFAPLPPRTPAADDDATGASTASEVP